MLASGIAKGSSLTGETPSYSAPAAFGRFQVLHQVGAGVLGPVFLARDPERARSVAIKVFRLDITPEQASELAAHLAALAHATLAHPSIVVPFEAGVEGTVPFIAEDYVTAESLDAAIRQYGPPPTSQAIRILAAVAGALDFAGAVGILHGALHPRDLLVTADETRVTGFGIARALETIGMRAPMRRPYVAPERVQREGWDGRADIYSLGVLAREMLLGRARGEAEQPRLPEDQAEQLQAVLSKATAARPVDRHQTALELMSAIQNALILGRHGAAVTSQPMAPAVTAASPRSADLLLPLEEGEPSTAAELPPISRDSDRAPASADSDVAGQAPLAELTGQASLAEPDVRTELLEARTENPAVDSLPDLDLHPEHAVEATPPRLGLAGPGGDIGPTEQPSAETPVAAARFADVETPPLPAEPAGHHASIPAALESAATTSRSPDGDRSRSLVPVVAILVVGLICLAAGYLLGVRRGAPSSTSASTTAPASTQQTPGAAPSNAPAQGAPGAKAPAPVVPLPAPRSVSPGQKAEPPAGSAPAARPSNARATAKAALVVRSTPQGAAVSINGRRRGVTPLRLRGLDPGRYKVSVSRQGYDTEEREVVLSADRSPTLTFSLDRTQRAQSVARTDSTGRNDFFGTLSVDSLPAGARVFVDGKLVGTTPLAPTRLPAGSHVVRVDMTGFLPWTTPIQITTGQRKTVTASLERESR